MTAVALCGGALHLQPRSCLLPAGLHCSWGSGCTPAAQPAHPTQPWLWYTWLLHSARHRAAPKELCFAMYRQYSSPPDSCMRSKAGTRGRPGPEGARKKSRAFSALTGMPEAAVSRSASRCHSSRSSCMAVHSSTAASMHVDGAETDSNNPSLASTSQQQHQQAACTAPSCRSPSSSGTCTHSTAQHATQCSARSMRSNAPHRQHPPAGRQAAAGPASPSAPPPAGPRMSRAARARACRPAHGTVMRTSGQSCAGAPACCCWHQGHARQAGAANRWAGCLGRLQSGGRRQQMGAARCQAARCQRLAARCRWIAVRGSWLAVRRCTWLAAQRCFAAVGQSRRAAPRCWQAAPGCRRTAPGCRRTAPRCRRAVPRCQRAALA